ncbi:MAG: hypothetical protein AAGG72_04730 [Pseudomonadota bacterium]
MLITFAVVGYRSLRDLVFSLGRLTIVAGGNVSSKSSLYPAMRLLAGAGIWSLAHGDTQFQKSAHSGLVALNVRFNDIDDGYTIHLRLPILGRRVSDMLHVEQRAA